MKYLYTFGTNHVDKDLKSLHNFYVIIEADDPRSVMFDARDRRWSMEYVADEQSTLDMINKWGIKEKSLDEVKITYTQEEFDEFMLGTEEMTELELCEKFHHLLGGLCIDPYIGRDNIISEIKSLIKG